MNELQVDARSAQLKNKKICRFCLSQNDELTNMYSRENRIKSSAPLPLQVMACVSIEVFTNDGMPSTICDNCRIVMEHCYRFKQMCKKADNALRQFPLTGIWPSKFELPKIPEELLRKQYPELYAVHQHSSIESTSDNEQEEQSHIDIAISKTQEIKTESYAIDPRTTSVKVIRPIKPESPSVAPLQRPSPGRPKLLNKNSNKILNKNAIITSEPMLSEPKIKRDNAGNMEIVTEIIESKYEEPDPIKNAAKVETNVFPCEHCERSFPLRQLLDIHMVNHIRQRSFQCEHCDKKFFSKYDLGKHMLIHTGEKPFKCVVCNKAFTRSTLLYRHEKVHTDQPKFLCVFCEKPFLSTDELEKHTERHRKNRPFSCKICGKRFAFKQGLERHETIHAKEQPYKCEYCDLSFSTPSKLARHLTAHAGDRPFPCKLCPKSYLLSHHLTRHLRSHTQGSGSYKCYDCEKTFTTRDDLIYHSAVHATQTLVCPLCKEHFSDLDHVTEHIKEHAEGEQYACEFCDLIFMTPEKLQSHSDAQHSDDLAAYKEHASKNIKRESTMLYDDNSQEMTEGEVIQEFIIEEYHQDDQDEILDSRITHTLVKQEPEQNRNESTSAKRLSRGSSTEQSEVFPSKETEEEDYDMEIETLEREDDEEYMYSNSEPPKKYRKVTQVEPRKNDEDKSKRILNTRKPEENKPKMKQLAINTVLQQLPKGVTIIKKDKSPKEKRVEVKEISILNKSTQPAKTEHTTPSNKTGKIINTRPKSSEKPPQVEIIKRKRTGSPSTSPSTPTILNKTNNSEQTKTPPNQQPKKLVEMMIGDRKVKVQKIMMTKAEVAAMAKEGKIEMKGGTMILKQEKGSPKAIPKK